MNVTMLSFYVKTWNVKCDFYIGYTHTHTHTHTHIYMYIYIYIYIYLERERESICRPTDVSTFFLATLLPHYGGTATIVKEGAALRLHYITVSTRLSWDLNKNGENCEGANVSMHKLSS